MKKIYYKIKNGKAPRRLRIVLLSDLHDNVYGDLADTARRKKEKKINGNRNRNRSWALRERQAYRFYTSSTKEQSK